MFFRNNKIKSKLATKKKKKDKRLQLIILLPCQRNLNKKIFYECDEFPYIDQRPDNIKPNFIPLNDC